MPPKGVYFAYGANYGFNLTTPGRVVKKVRLGGYLSGATDDMTLDRARRTLNAYFREIEKAIPERWLAGRIAHVVTNPGIRAHLALFAEVLRYQHGLQQIDPFMATPDELASSAAECSVYGLRNWLEHL